LRRIVDLDPAAAFDSATSIIVQELLSRDEEEQIAYAGNLRMGFRLKPSEQRTARAIEPAKTFRADSSYLLTGGLGGLGLQVAAWLGKQGVGKLVLTTRSRTSVDARQEEITAIKALGIDLTIVQADVADAAAMRQLFARFAKHGDLPPLRGIFHMAADLDGSPIGAITEDQIRSMFRAKIAGTWNLYELSQSLPLDFFVAFSSTAAVLGASNLGHYAAANSFIDAMGSLDGAHKLSFTAINWGTWRTMRLASREVQQQYSSGGMLPMQDDAALGWLDSLVRMGEVQQRPMVAHVDWERLAPLYEATRKRNWLEFVRGGPPVLAPSAKPSWIAEPGESRRNALERVVQKEAARVLGFRRGELPGTNTRLAELGLDSLMAVNLRNRLQSLVGHGLSSTFAFEYPTPAQMAMALDLLLWGSGVVDETASISQRDEIQI
jgi:NAD(P)-dependent dehydrogenase (short-subunit alcohol dehydrogenase family)